MTILFGWHCAIVAILLGFAAAAAETTVNLVANPSFENVGRNNLPDNWSGDPAVYSRDVTVAHNGSASLKYTNNDPKQYVLCTQKLPVQSGWKLHFSAWVKTRNLVGKESGATICLEWTDRSGQWLGGYYPNGISGTHDWQQIQAMTGVPAEAGTVTLTCYARPGMTGEAWFDDVEVTRIIDPPMRSTVLSPSYRGRIPAEPSATVSARVRLNPSDLPLAIDQLQVVAAIRPAGQEKVILTATQRPNPPPQPTDISFPASDLVPGDYELTLRLLGPAGQELQCDRHPLTKLPTGATFKCAIDEHRRLLVDGKPFFPLGMYWSDINDSDLTVYADSKFNCIMPYESPTREQLDLAQQHGIKVIYSVKDWYFGTPYCPKSIVSAAAEETAVRQCVRQFRDHPAVLAWYLNDELGQEYLPRLEAHQRWVAEEDPQHPTWAVLYQVGEVGAYLKSFDVIGTDPYPIGHEPASLVARWTAQTLAQVERSRAMWQVPQMHNWANYPGERAEHAHDHTPTPQEERSMAWQCICEGATGLVFYSWFDIKRNPDVPFAKQWQAMKTVAAEIDRFAPVLLSIEPRAAVVSPVDPHPAWLHWIVRVSGGKTYVFATNDGDGEGPVTFTLPPGARSIRELTEGLDIPPRGATFTDNLPKLGVKVYAITTD